MDPATDLLTLTNQHLFRAKQPSAVPAAPDELAHLITTLGFTPPAQLTQWLALCSGGFIDAGDVATLYGTHRRFNILTTREHVSWFSTDPRCLPIADDGFGNFYFLICPTDESLPAPVVFLDYIGDETHLAGSSLFKFLELALTQPTNNPSPTAGSPESPFSNPDLFFAIDPDARNIPHFGYAWT